MGRLNRYMNEQEWLEEKKGRGLFAIAEAIDNLAKAIIQSNKEKLEALEKSEAGK